MKKMRLDDIYRTVYHLPHSDEKFRKNAKKGSLPLFVGRTIFETALKPRGISESVQHGEVAPNP